MKLRGEVIKTQDKQLVFGFASAADVEDSQGDVISAQELEEAVYAFVTDSRRGRQMHTGRQIATLVESLFITEEKARLLGITEHINHWWVGFRVTEKAVWEKVKRGELKMFSIGGRARRTENE